MQSSMNRRRFLKTTGTLAAGVSLAGLSGSRAGAETVRTSSPAAEELGWLVACQLYTFRRFSFYEAIEMIAPLGIRHLEPCFFLRLDKNRPGLTTSEALSADVRKELKARLADRGMGMPNYYAGLGADADKARKTFEFAKELGTGTIVSEPPAEAFDMIEKLCDEYEINLAVHNHPESPQSKYWKPENVLAVCRGRGKRIGACCDTGHWVRSGLKPVECLKKLEGRILGFHLKDVAEWDVRNARDVPLGTGKADYAAVLAELDRQGYRGVMSIEYEHDSPQLSQDVAQCVAFVEKTSKELAG